MKKTKIWTKNFLLAMLANLFVSLVFYLTMTTLAIYSMRTWNTSTSLAGLTASIFVIGALVSRIFVGRYIELVGRRKLVYIGAGLFLAGSLSYFFAFNIGLLLAFRFAHGIAFGIINTAVSTVVLSFIPDERKGEGVGYYSMSGTLSTAVGPFIGTFLTQNFPYRALFVTCSGFALCALVFILFVDIKDLDLSEEEVRKMKSGIGFRDFFETKALSISVIAVVTGICYSSVTSFVNSYAVEINTTKAASVFFLIYALVVLVTRPASGKLLDRKGENIVMYPAILVMASGLFMLGHASGSGFFLLSAALIALGCGNIMSCGQTIAVKSAEPQRIGMAISTFFVCLDAGTGIGPVIMGLIVPSRGFGGMYLVAGVVVALSLVLYYYVHGRYASKVGENV